MLTIVLATHNNHKLEEVKDILKNYPIQILSLSDLKIEEIDVKENKKTYKENALKKAKVYAKYTNYPIMSDDSGLEIESMNFAPGIKSSRYAKLHHGYNNAFKSIFKKIENQSRNAQFCCNIVFIVGKAIIICLSLFIDIFQICLEILIVCCNIVSSSPQNRLACKHSLNFHFC